jgi:hypothetical protein
VNIFLGRNTRWLGRKLVQIESAEGLIGIDVGKSLRTSNLEIR